MVQQLSQFHTRQRMARMSAIYNGLFYLRLPPLRQADGVRPGSVNNADTGTTLPGEVVAIVWGRVEKARYVRSRRRIPRRLRGIISKCARGASYGANARFVNRPRTTPLNPSYRATGSPAAFAIVSSNLPRYRIWFGSSSARPGQRVKMTSRTIIATRNGMTPR